MAKSADLTSVDHRFLMQCLPRRDEVVISRAKGTKVWDTAGKEYTDLFSGIAVANVGHCHPKVVAAIVEQANSYMHVSNHYYNDVLPPLAERLAKAAPPGLVRTFFANSGAEAVDGAVKVAKRYATARGKSGMVIISLNGSFHGRLSLTLTLTGQTKFKHDFGNYACYPGVIHAPAPYHYRYGGGMEEKDFGKKCADDMAEMIDNYVAGDVGAVLVEPIMGEGGIIVPPDTYLRAVQRLCRERQIPFIADEVQTGIGRTGKMFASEYWDLQPDIMSLAKALAGGLPIGAVMATEKIASSMGEGDHFSTFGGNPVSCAAAIAVLDIIREEGLVQNAARTGKHALERLEDIQRKREVVGDVRGRGLMVGVELVKSRKTKVPAQAEAAKVKDLLMKKGFLIGHGGMYKNVIRFQPPLIITQREVDSAMDALDDALAKAV